MEQTSDVKPARIPSHACLTCRKSVVKVKAGASVLESTRRVSSALNTGTGSVARIWAAWLPVIRSGKRVLINIELPQTYSLASYFYRRASLPTLAAVFVIKRVGIFVRAISVENYFRFYDV